MSSPPGPRPPVTPPLRRRHSLRELSTSPMPAAAAAAGLSPLPTPGHSPDFSRRNTMPSRGESPRPVTPPLSASRPTSARLDPLPEKAARSGRLSPMAAMPEPTDLPAGAQGRLALPPMLSPQPSPLHTPSHQNLELASTGSTSLSRPSSRRREPTPLVGPEQAVLVDSGTAAASKLLRDAEGRLVLTAQSWDARPVKSLFWSVDGRLDIALVDGDTVSVAIGVAARAETATAVRIVAGASGVPVEYSVAPPVAGGPRGRQARGRSPRPLVLCSAAPAAPAAPAALAAALATAAAGAVDMVELTRSVSPTFRSELDAKLDEGDFRGAADSLILRRRNTFDQALAQSLSRLKLKGDTLRRTLSSGLMPQSAGRPEQPPAPAAVCAALLVAAVAGQASSSPDGAAACPLESSSGDLYAETVASLRAEVEQRDPGWFGTKAKGPTPAQRHQEWLRSQEGSGSTRKPPRRRASSLLTRQTSGRGGRGRRTSGAT